MTPQEQQMIESLATRVNQTRLADKDRDAEQLLQQSLGRNPDAVYILAQTVLVQDYALQQAQRQLADARAQLQQSQQPPQQHTSFLGNLFGHVDPPPPPPVRQMQTSQPVNNQAQPVYAPVPGYPPASAPAYGPPASAGGGFLRGAMQTAAGVAAGALAFEGVESLMHGFGNAGGYGSENIGGFGGGQPREEVINNYYGDSGDRETSRNTSDRSDFDNAAENNGALSPDLEDRRDNLSGNDNFAESTDADNDSNSFDGSSSSFDDGNNSFDDGASDDSGGGGDSGDSNFS